LGGWKHCYTEKDWRPLNKEYQARQGEMRTTTWQGRWVIEYRTIHSRDFTAVLPFCRLPQALETAERQIGRNVSAAHDLPRKLAKTWLNLARLNKMSKHQQTQLEICCRFVTPIS
jgi:hypothetical protein